MAVHRINAKSLDETTQRMTSEIRAAMPRKGESITGLQPFRHKKVLYPFFFASDFLRLHRRGCKFVFAYLVLSN